MPTYPMIDPRKQRASDIENYEDSHFAVALANPVLLATCSLSRRRRPLDPTPSFEESIKDLTNDANRADSESGKTYAEEYVVHGECILVCATRQSNCRTQKSQDHCRFV